MSFSQVAKPVEEPPLKKASILGIGSFTLDTLSSMVAHAHTHILFLSFFLPISLSLNSTYLSLF